MSGDVLGIAIGLGVTLVLILLNAMFVFHEFSFVVIKPAQARRLATGSRAGRLVAKGVGNLDHYIAVDQLGITVTSIAVGWIGQPIVADLLRRLFGVGGWSTGLAPIIAAVIAFVMLTAFQMIAGELMPKTVALRHPEPVARLVAGPVEVTSRLFHPIVVVLNGLGALMVRALGFTPTGGGHGQLLRVDEITAAVELSAREGALDVNPATLRRALNFSESRANDLLVPRPEVIALDATWPWERVREVAWSSKFTRFPVYKESIDHVIGVLNIKDLARLTPNGQVERVSQWRRVVRSIPTVPETASIEQVLVRLRRDRQQMALVVDEYGGTAGILTVADITKRLMGDTEEIRPIAPGQYLLRGRANVSAIENGLGISFGHQEDDEDSIGGLIMAHLQRIPVVGDTATIHGHSLEVMAVDGPQIKRVRLAVKPGGESLSAPLDDDPDQRQ